MPDEYWSKIGDSLKPNKAPGARYVHVPKAASKDEKTPDGSELFWCPACKVSQKEKKWRERAWHTRCRGCGLIIHLKNEKAPKEVKEKYCKVCKTKLRKGNGTGTCELCTRL
jgi:Pyruvate/2-oxoacid:ferredoxin oxidoreductase delta subunit